LFKKLIHLIHPKGCTMTSQAREALCKILALRKYPYAQSELAEARILKNLNITDYIEVITALEIPSVPTVPSVPSTSVPRE
jgi:hypothetical protein